MSAAPRIVGLNEVTEQPREEVWADGRLVGVYRTWEGPRAKIEKFVVDNAGLLGNSQRLRLAGRKATLSCEFDSTTGGGGGRDGVEKVTWELRRPHIEKDIKSHESWAVAESNATTRGQWFYAADVYLQTGDRADLTRLGGSGSVPAWVDSYIRDRQLGVESYHSNYWVVRKTLIISSRSQFTANDSGAWTASTTSPLANAGVSVSSAFMERAKFDVPEGLEWLRVPGECVEVGGRRYRLVLEWWGAKKWHSRYYSGGTGP